MISQSLNQKKNVSNYGSLNCEATLKYCVWGKNQIIQKIYDESFTHANQVNEIACHIILYL